MKLKQGFVSNSSSTSFVLTYDKSADVNALIEGHFDEWFKIAEQPNSFVSNMERAITWEIESLVADGETLASVNECEMFFKDDTDDPAYQKTLDSINAGNKVVFFEVPDSGDGGSHIASALRYMGRELLYEAENFKVEFDEN